MRNIKRNSREFKIILSNLDKAIEIGITTDEYNKCSSQYLLDTIARLPKMFSVYTDSRNENQINLFFHMNLAFTVEFNNLMEVM